MAVSLLSISIKPTVTVTWRRWTPAHGNGVGIWWSVQSTLTEAILEFILTMITCSRRKRHRCKINRCCSSWSREQAHWTQGHGMPWVLNVSWKAWTSPSVSKFNASYLTDKNDIQHSRCLELRVVRCRGCWRITHACSVPSLPQAPNDCWCWKQLLGLADPCSDLVLAFCVHSHA